MPELARTLGAWSLGLYGLGAIIGAGIYSVVGVAAGKAGDSLWLGFVISGSIAAITALSYAELATAYPEAGGELVYLKHAAPRRPWLAFTVGALVVLSSAATVATVSIAFAGYLRELIDVPVIVTALCALSMLTLIAVWGVRESTNVTAIFTLIEVSGLLLVVWAGSRSEAFGQALASVPSVDVVAGASLVFFAFLGFENIVNLAAEVKQPERALPRAIIGSLLVAIALYVLVALSVVALLDPQELARSQAPLMSAVQRVSPGAARVLGAVALFATANTALASIVSGSRVIYAMARVGDVPAVIGQVLPRRKTPWVATLILSLVALALLPLGGVEAVASVSSFAALVAFASVNVAVVVLRRTQPDLRRPFVVPLVVAGVPLLPVVGVLCSLGLIIRLSPVSIALGVVFAVVLALGYVALHRRA